MAARTRLASLLLNVMRHQPRTAAEACITCPPAPHAQAAFDPEGVFSKPQTMLAPGASAPDVPLPMHLWDEPQGVPAGGAPAPQPAASSAPGSSGALLAALLAAGAALLLPLV